MHSMGDYDCELDQSSRGCVLAEKEKKCFFNQCTDTELFVIFQDWNYG